MSFSPNFFVYLLTMAAVTYLVRMIPLVFCRGKIKNKFINSFLYYIPYAVLSAMTFPAVLYSTSHTVSAAVAVLVSAVLSYLGRSLLTVSAVACASVFITELLLNCLPI